MINGGTNVCKSGIALSAGQFGVFSKHWRNWSLYWAKQTDKILFFAWDNTDLFNKVVGGHLPNQLNGSSDYLTVTGTGLDARYRTPDNSTYRNADTDYCFWKTDASESTCDGNRLIAYDFVHTIVYYSDTSPYTIKAIMILSSAFETARENKMRDSFHLSIWWDGFLSSHGNYKLNRGMGRNVWSEYDTDAVIYFSKMDVQPNDATKDLISNLFKELKLNYIWTFIDSYVLLNLHTEQASLLNIIDAATDFTNPHSMSWATKVGFTGDSGKHLHSNYNMASSSVKYKQNDASIIFTRTIGTANVIEGVWDYTNNIMCGVGQGIYNYVNALNAAHYYEFTRTWASGFCIMCCNDNLHTLCRDANGETTYDTYTTGLANAEYLIGDTATGSYGGNNIYKQYGFAGYLDATRRAAFESLINAFNIAILTAF